MVSFVVIAIVFNGHYKAMKNYLNMQTKSIKDYIFSSIETYQKKALRPSEQDYFFYFFLVESPKNKRGGIKTLLPVSPDIILLNILYAWIPTWSEHWDTYDIVGDNVVNAGLSS